MDKVEKLKQSAIEFRALLEKYAKTDSDVEDFLRRITPWFEKIDKGEIVPPCYDYQLFRHFTNPDLSPLADKYFKTDLSEASAIFTASILDL
jgi:hypothetical protein